MEGGTAVDTPAFNAVISEPWSIWAAAIATLMLLAFLIAPALVWWVNRETYLNADDKFSYYFLPYALGLGLWVAALVITFLVCCVVDLWIWALS